MNSKEENRMSCYFWNMCSGVLNSLQSVIWLMVLTRVQGIEAAGIFTIAYAVSNLTLTFGKFGMRSFQVSDIHSGYSFSEYRASRKITVGLMIFISFLYVSVMFRLEYYSFYKSCVVLMFCILKALDAIEDVYHGIYQREGKLDVAGKIMSLRFAATIFIFIVMLIFTGDLLMTAIISTIISGVILAISINMTGCKIIDYNCEKRKDKSRIAHLLLECLPLCLCGFFSFFIGNLPKYIIDILLDETDQAYFGFIYMPVFVISLTGNILYQPVIRDASLKWNKTGKVSFKKMLNRELTIILSCSGIVVMGLIIIGIPLLEKIYKVSLYPFKKEFAIIMIGGIFFAISIFLNIILTIMRLSEKLLYTYIIVSLTGVFFSYKCIKQFGLMGAAVTYCLLEFLLCLLFVISIQFEISKYTKKEAQK